MVTIIYVPYNFPLKNFLTWENICRKYTHIFPKPRKIYEIYAKIYEIYDFYEKKPKYTKYTEIYAKYTEHIFPPCWDSDWREMLLPKHGRNKF